MGNWVLTAMLALFAWPAAAMSPSEILSANSRSIVYLEFRTEKGDVLERGSGFVISHDGFLLTAAHMKPETEEGRMWAVLAARAGTSYPLTPRGEDRVPDVALWQLPQSSTCRAAVTFASKKVVAMDPVLAMGFPGNDGLTPSSLTILNLNTTPGYWKADGFLEPGYSGGPVFDQDGRVVGIVHGGGMPGTESNHIIPINFALPLLQKASVAVGVDTPPLYEEACFASCRDVQHGVDHYGTEVGWEKASGWLNGGNNQVDVCNGLAAAVKQELKADEVVVTEKWEDSRKKLGHATYKYHCKGLARKDPVYVEKRSDACGLWQ